MNICIYGASSNEIDKVYIEKVETLGALLAQKGHTLIFGGGGNGVMGASARGVHSKNGKIIGVVPSFLNVDGMLFDKCDELIYTETMRDRKQKMEDLSDAFIMAPGGIGTYEEFFEILTLKQLGRHNKAIVIYNINSYFDEFLKMLEKTAETGFMKKTCLEIFMVTDDENKIIDYLESYVPENADVRNFKNI